MIAVQSVLLLYTARTRIENNMSAAICSTALYPIKTTIKTIIKPIHINALRVLARCLIA